MREGNKHRILIDANLRNQILQTIQRVIVVVEECDEIQCIPAVIACWLRPLFSSQSTKWESAEVVLDRRSTEGIASCRRRTWTFWDPFRYNYCKPLQEFIQDIHF
jgi:hypothetical protein